jgi:hypothetical protein
LDLFRKPSNLRLRGKIGREEFNLIVSRGLANLVGDPLAATGVATHEDDMGSRDGERPRRDLANPGGGAGHQASLANHRIRNRFAVSHEVKTTREVG